MSYTPMPLVNDPGRDATATLRGFSYQILRTIEAWIDLPEGEILMIEGAEDLDRIGPVDALVEQVKDTAGSGGVTLRSESVLEAIANLHGHQERNRDVPIRFRFLTTSPVGREQGDPLGLDVPGLEVWERIRRDPDAAGAASAAEAIRSFLAGQAGLRKDVRNWIAAAATDDFVKRIVAPLEWVTGQGDIQALTSRLEARLIELGDRRSLSAPDALIALDALHRRAWQVATDAERRPLRRGDMLRIVDEAGRTSISKVDLGRLISAIRPGLEASPSAKAAPRSTARSRVLLDKTVEAERERIRRGRFHSEFPTQEEARSLAAQLVDGELAGASDEIRARALACCARWQALKADPAAVEALLVTADRLADTEETVIARAFVAGRDDWKTGLRLLSPLHTPGRRSAALQVVVNGRSPAEALLWLEQAGFVAADLDSDGRHTLLSCRLLVDDWDGAYREAAALSDADFATTPALQSGAALARIARVVPSDMRAVVANGPPLDAAMFPMADDEAALAERRKAARLLRGAEQWAADFGGLNASRSYANLALWLELRDPAYAATARAQLESFLSDPEQAVAYLPLGLAFGVSMDREVIERTLAQHEALEPDGSTEMALARLALANSSESAGEAADYLARYRDLIWKHLNKAGVLEIEVRVLAAANRLELAHERLIAFGDVLDQNARRRLDDILTQAADGPTTANLEAAFKREPNTANLALLVTHLGEQGYSDRFFELARQLVTSTRTVLDAENLVRSLLRHDRHNEVAIILADSGLVRLGWQSLGRVAAPATAAGAAAQRWKRVPRRWAHFGASRLISRCTSGICAAARPWSTIWLLADS